RSLRRRAYRRCMAAAMASRATYASSAAPGRIGARHAWPGSICARPLCPAVVLPRAASSVSIESVYLSRSWRKEHCY
ncbi:hypothetical protein H4R99_008623, partial [Coemansia sp. RSA 1722]